MAHLGKFRRGFAVSTHDPRYLEKSLLRAARERDIRRMKEMLKNGANPDYEEGGFTSLAYVSGYGMTDAVELLLDHGANPNCVSSRNGFTPLHWAAYRNHAPIVRLLLQFGSNANTKNHKNQVAAQLSSSSAIKQAFAAARILPKRMPSKPYTGKQTMKNSTSRKHSLSSRDADAAFSAPKVRASSQRNVSAAHHQQQQSSSSASHQSPATGPSNQPSSTSYQQPPSQPVSHASAAPPPPPASGSALGGYTQVAVSSPQLPTFGGELPPPPSSGVNAVRTVDQLIEAPSWDESQLWSVTASAVGVSQHASQSAPLPLDDQRALIRELRQLRRQHAHLEEYCRALGRQSSALARRLTIMEGFIMSGGALHAHQNHQTSQNGIHASAKNQVSLAHLAPQTTATTMSAPGSWNPSISSASQNAGNQMGMGHIPQPPPPPPQTMLQIPSHDTLGGGWSSSTSQSHSSRVQVSSGQVAQATSQLEQSMHSMTMGAPYSPVPSPSSSRRGRSSSGKITALQQKLVEGMQSGSGMMEDDLPAVEWDDDDDDDNGMASHPRGKEQGISSGPQYDSQGNRLADMDDDAVHREADDQLTDRESHGSASTRGFSYLSGGERSAPMASVASTHSQYATSDADGSHHGAGPGANFNTAASAMIERVRRPPSATESEQEWSSVSGETPVQSRRNPPPAMGHQMNDHRVQASTVAAKKATAKVEASGLFDDLEDDSSLFGQTSGNTTKNGQQASEDLASSLFQFQDDENEDDSLFA